MSEPFQFFDPQIVGVCPNLDKDEPVAQLTLVIRDGAVITAQPDVFLKQSDLDEIQKTLNTAKKSS